MHQIAHELDVIEQLNFPGYFLVLVDIVEFCRAHDIYCQGRGSAANSAVCYALGVTKADAVALGPAVRAVPLARARRPARHRPRHRAPAARGGDPVRLRQVRPRARRAGGQRDHLPAALGAARDGEGRRVSHPVTPTRSPSGSTGGARAVEQATADRSRACTTTAPRSRRSRSTSPSRCSTSRATSASTRAGW